MKDRKNKMDDSKQKPRSSESQGYGQADSSRDQQIGHLNENKPDEGRPDPQTQGRIRKFSADDFEVSDRDPEKIH